MRKNLGFALSLILAFATSGCTTNTDVGAITIKSGYPLVEDGKLLMDNLKLNRATELFLWSLPINQTYAGRDGLMAASKGTLMDVNYIGDFSDHRVGLSTLNNETIYAIVNLDLSKGPVVYEQPVMDAKGYMFGSIIDVWQVAMTDVGVPKVTPDQGKGGKYLILPPSYQGKTPDGYMVIKSNSNAVTLGLRSVMQNGATVDDAIARVKLIKVYPLANPEQPQVYNDLANMEILAEVDKGIGAFKRMHEYINSEVISDKDKYMVGLLKTIGIEKGKPFPVDEKILALYQRAADIAWMTAKQIMTTSWEPGLFGGWLAIGLADTWTPDYTTEQAILADRRIAYFTLGIWPPKNMGTSTFYTHTFTDANDEPLKAGVNYKLTLPADVPVSSFWSVIAYDAERFTMIDNPDKKYTVNSLQKGVKLNADGSIDIYLGPNKPVGFENNWIPTTENDFWAAIRFYGPDWDRLGKSWKAKRPVPVN